jgi:hypothetical protein
MRIERRSSKADSRSAQGLHYPKPAKQLAWLLAAALLTGCAHRYDMTLTNGMRLTNVSKPILDRESGVYTYKDVSGKVRHVFAGRVVEIAPHSRKNKVPGSMQQSSLQ